MALECNGCQALWREFARSLTAPGNLKGEAKKLEGFYRSRIYGLVSTPTARSFKEFPGALLSPTQFQASRPWLEVLSYGWDA